MPNTPPPESANERSEPTQPINAKESGSEALPEPAEAAAPVEVHVHVGAQPQPVDAPSDEEIPVAAPAKPVKWSQTASGQMIMKGLIPVALILVTAWANWRFGEAADQRKLVSTEVHQMREVVIDLRTLLEGASADAQARGTMLRRLETKKAAELAAMVTMVQRLERAQKLAAIQMAMATALPILVAEEVGRMAASQPAGAPMSPMADSPADDAPEDVVSVKEAVEDRLRAQVIHQVEEQWGDEDPESAEELYEDAVRGLGPDVQEQVQQQMDKR